MDPFDHEVDFLVVGSGAAALTAGIRAADLGLQTLLVEKDRHYGGSTAMGSGIVWIGDNRYMRAASIADSPRETLMYLLAITDGEAQQALLDVYAQQAPRMLDYLVDRGHLRCAPMPGCADHYPEQEGGKPGGRALEPEPIDGSLLGDALATLHPPADGSLHGGQFMLRPSLAHRALTSGPLGTLAMAAQRLRYALRASRRSQLGGRDAVLTGGNALVARLRMTLDDRSVPVWLDSPAESLIVDGGRVVGAEVNHDGALMRVGTRRGVLIAAGGFDRNLKMRERYGPKPASITWSTGSAANTGDGIRMGMLAGAGTALLDGAWWAPVTQLPGAQDGHLLARQPHLPGAIFVNGEAERFTNEAAPPHDVASAIYRDHRGTGASIPCWMIFDARYRKRYGTGSLLQGEAAGDGWLRVANSVGALAAKLGVDAAKLEATVERFNGFARSGDDDDFARGVSAFDRCGGDPRIQPNPCLAPLRTAPFHAIPVYPGDVGTCGGLRIDAAGRATDNAGKAIEGLYAAGNSSASIMGRTSPGPGGPLGPAMLMAFLAAEHAAEHAAQDP